MMHKKQVGLILPLEERREMMGNADRDDEGMMEEGDMDKMMDMMMSSPRMQAMMKSRMQMMMSEHMSEVTMDIANIKEDIADNIAKTKQMFAKLNKKGMK